ncbi:MAG TPA: response regulator [Wenzhouxiangellaceae bacterium]|nr:response regulator [Wenzhouxiangellaceae bacterium]
MSNQGSREIESLAVLAVDDHEINRDFIQAALAPAVASLELAGSGFEAIERCRNRRFDIVLMDLHMPDMDGLTAWEQIRGQATGELSMRVIALTADSRPEERERLRCAGFHGFLSKPVSPGLLLLTIRRVVAGRDGFTEIQNPAERRALLLDDARAARACGSPARARQMRTALATEIDDHWASLDDAVSGGRWEDAAEQLHQWAGACGYSGATRLEQACASLEASLRRDLDSSPGSLYLNLVRTVESTRQSIKAAQPD